MDEKILKVCERVPKNIERKEINKIRIFRQTLTLYIKDNELYLRSGLKGEPRHMDIINQLFEVRKQYTLPDIYAKFIYIDRVNMNDSGGNLAVFNHLHHMHGDDVRFILSPCFSFNGYTSGQQHVFVSYQEEMNNIMEKAKKFPWIERESSMILKGYLNYPHRQKIINELEERMDCCELLLKRKNIKCLFQNSVGDLAKYRYQLMVNGFGNQIGTESGSIRPKYMLATGSICIYIHLGTVIREWWMYLDDCCIISCETVDEAIEKVRYFEQNTDKALEHLEKQKKFADTYLNEDFVKKYWYQLLNTYAGNCNFKVNHREVRKLKKLKQEELHGIVNS